MLKTVTKNSPCPICGKPDQCSKSEDGLICCYREESHHDGYRIVRHATARDGRGYTLYSPGSSWHHQSQGAAPVINPLLATVYEHILKRLPCEPEEQQELARRGITDHSGFGSMPFNNASLRGTIAAELLELHGEAIWSVPGISKNNPSGKGVKPWLEGPEGLLIPLRDWHGKIQSVQIRPRERGDGPKYLFLSSTRTGGSAANPCLHIPTATSKRIKNQLEKFENNLPVGMRGLKFPGKKITISESVWVTEGALKAEVLVNAMDIAAIGSPANNAEPAYPFIASHPNFIFILAYDQDTNPAARRITTRNLLRAFDRFPNHDISLAVWNPEIGKGIDDLVERGTVKILARAEALDYLWQFCPQADEQLFREEENQKEYWHTEWTEALSLKARYGQDMICVQEWNDFLVWNGKTWEQDPYGPAILYKRFLNERTQAQMTRFNGLAREDTLKDGEVKWLMGGHKITRINNVVAHLRSEADLRKKVKDIPVVRYVLTCPNGTINLTTGELRAHNRDDWQQSCCPTKFNPEAKCERWLKLLDDVFLGSKDLILYVQKLFGMAITGQPNDHLFPVFMGDGRNGKSTILGTIQQVLGSGLSGSVDSQHLCKGTDRHPTWLASFHQRRLMVAQETARGMELNVSLVKMLTGGDQVTCRRMHENEWSFLPTHTLILCTNERPNIPESNAAIWSRISLVPFRASFSAENGNLDVTLPTRIMQEAEGILNWLVQGALLYQREGLTKPEEVVGASQEYREDNDPEQSILLWLDQFTIETDKWFRTREIYGHYYQWSLDAGIRALGIKNFGIGLSKQKNWERRKLDGYREFRLHKQVQRNLGETEFQK